MNISLVINFIPLGLWQLKMEFEDSLINCKRLFLKAEKFSEFFIFKSHLFNSMTGNVKKKKRISKKIMFSLEVGNVIISSCIMFFTNARKYFEKILRRLTFKYFEK